VKVDGDGQVGGMLSGVGQRMLPGVAKMLMNQFFECLIAKAKSGSPQAPGVTSTAEG
jgi:carbon monoxide dehydrogenase subunit G